MITKIFGGRIVTDRKIERKDVYIEDGKIIAVTLDDMPFDKEIDAKGNYVSAGFIEIHTHGAGMPEGSESILGGKKDGLKVVIEDGVAKLPDRTAFAGSVAFCDRLVRNMVNMAEVPLEDAVYMITQTPAKIVGLHSKGSVEAGKDADVVIFDKDINIIKNIIGGRIVYSNYVKLP